MEKLAKNDDGFVMFSVIWIAGLLAVVTSVFAMAVRLHVKGEANMISSLKAELAADGLVRLAAFGLASRSQGGDSGTMALNGEPFRCRFGADMDATISIQDQAGLVDLNRSSLSVLASLIENAGKTGSSSTSLAEALADFRDSDSVRYGVTTTGAEENLVAGGAGMKNSPFQDVGEIEQVIPAEMADLGALKRMLTVYSRQDGIDPDSAPAALRAALGLDRGNRDAAIPFAPSQHRAFSIDAEVTFTDGSKFRRIAMISILREPQRPFVTLEWRQGAGPVANATPDASNPSCVERVIGSRPAS